MKKAPARCWGLFACPPGAKSGLRGLFQISVPDAPIMSLAEADCIQVFPKGRQPALNPKMGTAPGPIGFNHGNLEGATLVEPGQLIAGFCV